MKLMTNEIYYGYTREKAVNAIHMGLKCETRYNSWYR